MPITKKCGNIYLILGFLFDQTLSLSYAINAWQCEMLRIALHVHKRRKKGPTVVDRRRRGLIFRKGPEYYFAHNFKECKKGGKN